MRFLLQFNKNILAFIITSFFSLVMFFYNDSNQVQVIERSWLELFTVMSTPQNYYMNLVNNSKIIDSLKTEIVILSNKNNTLLSYEEDIRKLEDALKLNPAIRKKLDAKKILPCHVIKNNYISSNSTLLVSTGSNQGVKINQPVIDFYGHLMGKIIVVSDNSSKVQLITDKNFSVSVKLENQSFAQFKPTYGSLGKLEGVVKSSIINKGDSIYTSDISDIYSPNIPVCKVLDAIVDENDLFQSVTVEIFSNIENVNYVYVVQ